MLIKLQIYENYAIFKGEKIYYIDRKHAKEIYKKIVEITEEEIKKSKSSEKEEKAS